MREHPCRRKRLAQSAIATVEQCTCGKMHLHVGAVTLHFERDAFGEMVHTLNSAVDACGLDRHRAFENLRLLLGHLD